MAYFDFTDRVAIITGASGGIGSVVARAFAEQGASLALLDISEELLEPIYTELKEKGCDCITAVCDNTKEEDIKAAVEKTVEHFGKIDILLSIAGGSGGGKVEDMDQDYWDNTMAFNIRGAMQLGKYVVPHMLERNYGRIVLTSSVNAVFGEKVDPLVRTGYCTAKAGILGLTLAMGTYLGKYGITVNAICPGVTDTPQPRNSLMKYPPFEQWYNDHNPIGRIAQPEEMVTTYLYLADENTSHTNAQWIVVDGGFTKA
ncbi:MAG: SDR family NAD(P)-dependent oxidoreductase [Fastidiosipilaceae bacterium]|jgi:NAD(P)-dependent dehydrogenase (short-subunit alcohol dehydrogenase family)|nr:SDR family oxidoreductase [Clostridiaceae bacterium]